MLNEISAHVQRFGTGPGEVIVTNRLGRVAQRNSFGDCWLTPRESGNPGIRRRV